MIHDHDRSGWFGASDTARIMGRWDTPTFDLWWLVKLGIRTETIQTAAMQTGTAYEHRILDYIGIKKRDRQIRRWWLKLRVNLDGETNQEISEVKTYSSPEFKILKNHWMQCQVEMFVTHKRCRIVAYRLEEQDYLNWFREIDGERLSFHPIDYDPGWIRNEYLPKLRYLAKCLRHGKWPTDRSVS